MELLILLAVAAGVVWVLRRWRRDREEVRPWPEDPPEPAQVTLSLSMETRAYDPAKNRFDGLAYPEFHIVYADEDGVVTDRDIFVHDWRKKGQVTYYDCWCYLRDQRRMFRSDRMLEITNLSTKRKIKDISAYRTR